MQPTGSYCPSDEKVSQASATVISWACTDTVRIQTHDSIGEEIEGIGSHSILLDSSIFIKEKKSGKLTMANFQAKPFKMAAEKNNAFSSGTTDPI